MILTIPGKLTTLNEYIAANNRSRYHSAGMKKYDTQRVEWQIMSDKNLKTITDKRVFSFTWIRKNQKTDPDNIASFGTKVILDALVNQKILPNDGWKYVKEINHRFFQGKEDLTELEIIKI